MEKINIASVKSAKPTNLPYMINGTKNNNDIIDNDELIMMNNDFYNDDFYDYKDTFMSNHRRNSNKTSTNNNRKPSNHHNSKVYEENFDVDENDNKLNYLNGETDEEDEEEEDDEDEMNDFKTGPLAIHHHENNQNDNLANSPQFFSKHYVAEDEEERFEDGTDYYQEDEHHGNDELMNDTFFKRVDSMEMNEKPKKAKMVNNYLIGEVLGDGSYGKVKECIELSSLTRRAVKIINLKNVARKIPRGCENVRKEINIMKKLDHKNVIKLFDTFEKNTQPQATANAAMSSNNINLDKPPKLYIFMDYCMTSLEKLFKNAPNQRLCNYQANFYFKQLIDGLEYLHSLNIIHNDIKPGNLLITCDDVLKICDFSISAQIDPFCEYNYLHVTNNDNVEMDEDENDNNYINPNLLTNVSQNSRFPIIQCTPMFQCPEMLMEDMNELLILRNATKIDIWSTGITLYQLTTGQLPFQGTTIHQIFENIRSPANPINIPEYIHQNLSILLLGMLNRDPIERWSIKQIRDSEWFKRKHPVVREELAYLPEDVIQNESSTFRMLNYLEKYCQEKQLDQQQQQQQEEASDLTMLPTSDSLAQNFNNIQATESLTVYNINAKNSNNDDTNDYCQRSATLNSNTTSNNNDQKVKSLKRESKLKKTQCNLM